MRFSDVDAHHAFCPQIAWLSGKGITAGTMPDGSVEWVKGTGISPGTRSRPGGRSTSLSTGSAGRRWRRSGSGIAD